MSNYSLTAPCGCQILEWGRRRNGEPVTKLEPCALHGAAPQLLAACKEAIFLFAHAVGAMAAAGSDQARFDHQIEEAQKIKAQVNAAIQQAEGQR